MKIKLKVVKVLTKDLIVGDLKIVEVGAKDVNSINLEVWYRGVEIAWGHLNYKTNMAHITMNEDNKDNQTVEDYLVKVIEERTVIIE